MLMGFDQILNAIGLTSIDSGNVPVPGSPPVGAGLVPLAGTGILVVKMALSTHPVCGGL